jgi:hypothetical protein
MFAIPPPANFRGQQASHTLISVSARGVAVLSREVNSIFVRVNSLFER